MASAADIVIDAYGMFFNQSIFETLDIIGLKQCVRECQSRDDCEAVNYKRDDLQCQLLWTSTSNSSELQIDDKYQYITMESQTTVLKNCTTSCKDRLTVRLSSGQEYCVANTCPVNYRMNKKLKFCYLAFEERVYYFTTGMAHCRNIGSRLAILPTLDYHWYLVEEYQNNMLEIHRYRVGGFFNVTLGKWQWIDGSLVFDRINRTLTRVNDDREELAWHEGDFLEDFSTGNDYSMLCERII
nr:uncharacterized protein LOC105322701 [Crassostrea gigas]